MNLFSGAHILPTPMLRLLIAPLLALLASPVLAGAPLILEPRHDPDAPPHQFATPVPVRVRLTDFEPVPAPLSQTLRQLVITSPGASSIGFYLSTLELTVGASLHLRGEADELRIDGPYHDAYETPPFSGGSLTVTLEIHPDRSWDDIQIIMEEVAVGMPNRIIHGISPKELTAEEERTSNDRPREQTPWIPYACANPEHAP